MRDRLRMALTHFIFKADKELRKKIVTEFIPLKRWGFLLLLLIVEVFEAITSPGIVMKLGRFTAGTTIK